MQSKHQIEDLIQLFNATFETSENTQLVCCEEEPIYRPADEHHPYHRIIFAHGFYASALHEIAHWCIAGPERRQLVDFGYWYQPDGRSAEQQALFEKVEVKPQALEWIFSVSAGFPFHFSADNLEGETGGLPSKNFQTAVYQQVQTYLEKGMPANAEQFSLALCDYYQQDLKVTDFQKP